MINKNKKRKIKTQIKIKVYNNKIIFLHNKE